MVVLRRVMSILHESTNLNHFLQIHAFLVKTSLDRNNFVISKFLHQISSNSMSDSLHYTRSVFDAISSPDTFIWNTMIRAYLNSHSIQESLSLFFRMRVGEGLLIDSFSLSLVLQASGRLVDERNGEKIHTLVLRLGFHSDLFVQTALVEMYAKVGSLKIARKVFDEMIEPDLVLFNVMLAEYVRIRDMSLARQLFDKMPERDLVSWNTMIHGYALLGDDGGAYGTMERANEALKLFHRMQLAHVMPDKVTIVSVLSACGELGALGMGKIVHEYSKRKRLGMDMRIGTSLVNMYAKCGDIDNSMKVFNEIKRRDVFTWTAMIIGLANHGLGEVSLVYFSKMIDEGIKPNDITFIGVLSACSHIGLVDQGLAYFTSMRNIYDVSPKIEHYGCMVDILGRAGRLQEARKLIKSMPFSPDAIVWRTLLGACRIYKNVELAEEATVNLLQLEPHIDGNYVLLSNIYSQARKWDKVVNIRRMMKNVNVHKVPGSSSIEFDNEVHEFLVGDKSHWQSEQIYQMLAEMIDRVKHAGYEPLTTSVLQDLEEYDKENVLACHSEKLAIAFALLRTSPGSPIRIVKNLRVCDDCHLYMKFVSEIYDRKIIVRDRNRFHHFVGGLCSCKDYW